MMLRYSLFFLVNWLLLSSLPSWAQEQVSSSDSTISGDFRGLHFGEFVRRIEGNTPFRFYYQTNTVDTVRVNVQANELPLAAALRLILQPAGLFFAIDADRRVYITSGAPLQTRLPADYFGGPPLATARMARTQASASHQRVTPPVSEGNEFKVYEIGPRQDLKPGGKATLAGYVRDAQTGEPVVGVSVYIDEPPIGVTTDTYGYYALILPTGRHTLHMRGLGVRTTKRQLAVYADGRLDLQAQEDVATLKEVVVTGGRDRNVTSLRMGVTKLDIKTIKTVPTALGEADILRVILMLPGVKAIGEGNTGFSVRGGNTDQNLVLFNDATVFNPSHLFGFFSGFNPDLIKSVELYKSAIPARYGGRLSSVLDITTREGNKKNLAGTAGIGLLTSRLTLEGPLVKDKGSFLIGGRSSYSDWLLHQVPDAALKNSSTQFYDLSGHLSYNFSDRNSVYATGYYSHDQFRLYDDTTYRYNSLAASAKWKHNFSNKFYGVLTGTVSRYNYGLASNRNPSTSSDFSYQLAQESVLLDFTHHYNSKHTLDFGAAAILYHIESGQLRPTGDASLVLPVTLEPEKAVENAVYVGDNIEASPRLSLYLGLRYSLYNALGPRTVNLYQTGASRADNTVTGSTNYSNGQVLATYGGFEPRLSAKYMLTDQSSMKVSYNRMRQYIHQLTNTTVVSPTDSWKLSDTYIRPQVADQFSLGYYHNFRNNTLELSVETYYKALKDFLDYKSGAVLFLNPHLETDVVNARGRSYGVEILLRRTAGKLNGWLSYTYARSLVQIDTGTEQVNGGVWYAGNFDKPHDLTLVSNYRFSQRFSASFNLNYSTGRPITLPLAKYYVDNALRIYYSDRNAYRVPNYFRLDLAVNIDGNHKVKQRFHNSWTIAVYNLTGRHNPYSVYFRSENGQVNGYQLSIFAQPIPSVTYNVRF